MINSRSFVDGNKRIGIAAAALFLMQNSYRLTPTNPELEGFTRRVAEARPDLAEILKGMRANVLETVDIIDGLMEKEPPF